MKAPLDRGSAQHGAWPRVSGGRPAVGGCAVLRQAQHAHNTRVSERRGHVCVRSQFQPAQRIAEIPRRPAGSPTLNYSSSLPFAIGRRRRSMSKDIRRRGRTAATPGRSFQRANLADWRKTTSCDFWPPPDRAEWLKIGD